MNEQPDLTVPTEQADDVAGGAPQLPRTTKPAGRVRKPSAPSVPTVKKPKLTVDHRP